MVGTTLSIVGKEAYRFATTTWTARPPMLDRVSANDRSVLGAAPDALLIIDAFGTICYGNRHVCALFGYAPEQIIGESIELLFPERLRSAKVGCRNAFAGDSHMQPTDAWIELFGLRHDGTEFPLHMIVSSLEEATGGLSVVILRDSTLRKRVEDELIVARGAVEAMRDLADRMRHSARRLLSDARADLRQPLQALVLLNRMLRETVKDPDASELLLPAARPRCASAARGKALQCARDEGRLGSDSLDGPKKITLAEIDAVLPQ
jgi:PAS domain S-box-containing protein